MYARFRGRSSENSAIHHILLEVKKMAQKVVGLIKLQIPAGKATPAPPVGPALGQHGVNIMAFTKEFNERTKNDMGLIIPVVITVFADHSRSSQRLPPQRFLSRRLAVLKAVRAFPTRPRLQQSHRNRSVKSQSRKCPTSTRQQSKPQ